MSEGDLDRPGIIHLLKQIERSTWNFYTQKSCKKVKYKNNTGAPSMKGELVKFDPAEDHAVILTAPNDHEGIGAFAEDNVADGAEAEIITGGSAQYRLKDGTAATSGHWIGTSDVAGRADATLAAPPLGGVVQLDKHMQEVGHCCESVGAGTDELASGLMHFN